MGDTILLFIQGETNSLTVSGIYSDITNGGKTAKAAFVDVSTESMWNVFYGSLSKQSEVEKKVTEYADNFHFAKVSGIDEYIFQTFGTTINSIKQVSSAALVVALLMCVLVTLLFMKMLIAKDRSAIAILKSIGFTNVDISKQYAARSVVVLMLAIFAGTVLANTLGEFLTTTVIASFGAASFNFRINPLTAYVFCPLALLCVVLLATFIGTVKAGQLKIMDYIKE